MTNPPQAVTERYISNLLHYGRNKDFDICEIKRQIHSVDARVVGVYFQAITLPANLLDVGLNRRVGVGATAAQAIRHCLEQHGVTFR